MSDNSKNEETQLNEADLYDLKAEVFAEEILLKAVNGEVEEDSDGYDVKDPYA